MFILLYCVWFASPLYVLFGGNRIGLLIPKLEMSL